ncbi:hypothetical protein V6N13_017784 [Hibiscus sabdariffa]
MFVIVMLGYRSMLIAGTAKCSNKVLRNSVLAFVTFCAKHLCATIAAISWVVARN